MSLIFSGRVFSRITSKQMLFSWKYTEPSKTSERYFPYKKKKKKK